MRRDAPGKSNQFGPLCCLSWCATGKLLCSGKSVPVLAGGWHSGVSSIGTESSYDSNSGMPVPTSIDDGYLEMFVQE